MFGAADPEQAIAQLEAYYREGRGERAEVMASALVDQLMAQKDRDDDTQGILVKGLRILAGVFNSRQNTSEQELQSDFFTNIVTSMVNQSGMI